MVTSTMSDEVTLQLVELLELYETPLVSRRLLAEKEAFIFRLARSDAMKRGERTGSFDEWLKGALHTSLPEGKINALIYAAGTRHRIYSAGTDAMAVWDLIESRPPKISVGRAYELVTNAKNMTMRNPSLSLGEAVKIVVAGYMALPTVKTMDDGYGTQIRSATPDRKNPKTGKERRKIFSSEYSKKLDQARPSLSSAEEPFWKAIRQQVLSHLHEQLEGVDESIIHVQEREFVVGLKVLFDEHRKEWRRLKEGFQALSEVQGVSRERVLSACATLKLDPPAPGKPVDMVVVKRQYRKLAALYHEDKNAGATKEEFFAVAEALEALKQYNERFVVKLRAVPNGMR